MNQFVKINSLNNLIVVKRVQTTKIKYKLIYKRLTNKSKLNIWKI